MLPMHELLANKKLQKIRCFVLSIEQELGKILHNLATTSQECWQRVPPTEEAKYDRECMWQFTKHPV
jgi:hypothetical protein